MPQSTGLVAPATFVPKAPDVKAAPKDTGTAGNTGSVSGGNTGSVSGGNTGTGTGGNAGNSAVGGNVGNSGSGGAGAVKT